MRPLRASQVEGIFFFRRPDPCILLYMRRASIFLIALFSFPGTGVSAGTAPVKKLELGACTLPGLPPDARCGIHEVWENRVAKSGRKIPLRVAVLPAQSPDRLPDPFIYFEGGPGQSSVAAGPILGGGRILGRSGIRRPAQTAGHPARRLPGHRRIGRPDEVPPGAPSLTLTREGS